MIFLARPYVVAVVREGMSQSGEENNIETLSEASKLRNLLCKGSIVTKRQAAREPGWRFSSVLEGNYMHRETKSMP